MSKVPASWLKRFEKFRVELPPKEAGHVLVLFGEVPRIYMFGEDVNTWAEAVADLLGVDSQRTDTWAFWSNSPVELQL